MLGVVLRWGAAVGCCGGVPAPVWGWQGSELAGWLGGGQVDRELTEPRPSVCTLIVAAVALPIVEQACRAHAMWVSKCVQVGCM